MRIAHARSLPEIIINKVQSMRHKFLQGFLVALTALAVPARAADAFVGSVERLDPSLDALISPDARPEVIASGFGWSEGPVWRKKEGYLVFSDVTSNTIYRWTQEQGISVFLRPSGLAGTGAFGKEIGSNGMTLDPEGRLVIADQGNRSVVRLDESNWTKVVLADRYLGKRFNSPNDLVFRRNGDLYFTDPPYGLFGKNDDPHKELKFNGVYRLDARGNLTLLTDALTYPNGIAFSPDENTLYIQVSDPDNAVWMAYDVTPDGGIANGRVFFDANALLKRGRIGLPDGMRLDVHGNIFGGGPGGVLILCPSGRHLGTILTGQLTANCVFGEDGSTLFMTADHFLMRIRLKTKGVGF
jgi:gluconolactonase